jgi:hypothetical protein
MATRAVLQTFERYQKERVAFVSAVAEMAKSPQVGSKPQRLSAAVGFMNTGAVAWKALHKQDQQRLT